MVVVFHFRVSDPYLSLVSGGVISTKRSLSTLLLLVFRN